MSNTYYLEKHLGWSGIGIDAQKEYARGYALNRLRTKFFSYIVSDHSGGRENFYRLLAEKGLSSTDRERMLKNARHLFLNEDRQVFEMETITLDEILEKEGIQSIDFLNLDIEGGELKALEGFDIQKYRPRLVCVARGRELREIQAYFQNHGYRLIKKYFSFDDFNMYFEPEAIL